MQKGKKSMQKEPQKISDSEEKAEFYQKETKDVEIPSMLLVYMPLRNIPRR